MQQQKWSNTADLSFKPVDLSAKRKMPVLKDANSCSPSKKSLPSYMRQSGSSWSFKNSSPAGSPNTRPGNSTPVNSYKNYMHNENLSLSGELDGVRSPMRPGGYGISVRIRTPEGSFRASNYSHELGTDTKELGRQVTEASNCDAAGILYKWVNFGKGWRPRWFVLLDGVLSYYKLHGSDKISVTEETERGLRVIGENSVQLMRKGTSCHGRAAKSNQRKTVGAIHLKVSTIRESNSDDKKFSIFTGTKTLHLKAESREDKAAWIDILSSAKERFPSTSVSRNQLLPIEEITLSTDKLRCRLLEAGLKENVIRDCEEIMLSEFAQMQSQLKILQERGFNLLDTLRQLEVEKIELETTVVDESQCNLKARHSSEGGQEKSSASATESEEDNERQNGMEVESDEDDDIYFDTRDSLSESRRSTSSLYRRSSVGSDEELSDCGDIIHGTSGEEMEPELHGPGCPIMRRRRSLPEPLEKEKGVSLWSMIKDNIGKDLTKVCLPVYFNEPLSSLQKCFEDLEYSYLIDRASEWGKKGNSLMRILNVAAFAVSAYASSEGRNCKPFNPLLGETYEADYPDKGVRFLAEKVSHHPMMIACHCQGRGWRFWGDSNLKSKFWGRSIQLDPVGILTLEFDDGEVFQWSKVTTSIYNLILGKLYCDHYGTMRIQGNCEYFCKLKFKEQSIIDRSPHQVQGFVQDKSGNKVATLFGKWDESMFYVLGDINTKPKGYDPMSDACLLWKRSKPPKNPTRYNLTSFAITLNELTPGLKEKLPPTDSRLRPDQRYLENGQYELANSEKLRLEQRQRQVCWQYEQSFQPNKFHRSQVLTSCLHVQSRKLQETGWKPRWFYKEKGQDTFKYIGGYWEARERGQWDNCPDIFGETAHEIAID